MVDAGECLMCNAHFYYSQQILVSVDMLLTFILHQAYWSLHLLVAMKTLYSCQNVFIQQKGYFLLNYFPVFYS